MAQLYAGRILGLIGIAQIDNNISVPVERIVGNKRTINWLTDYATNPKLGVVEEVTLLDYGAKEFLENLREKIVAKGIPSDRVNLAELGPVGGSHGGPGTVAMVVLR